jgi:3-oxoacyl-(acyl-carrier-protein) synthase
MELTRNGHPRLVISGMAAISSLGQRDEFWENLKNGVSGIKKLEHLDLEHLNVHRNTRPGKTSAGRCTPLRAW